MLEIKNLTIKLKDRYLTKDLSFTLNSSDKLAMIGEEGNGKSTILKAILGICDYAEISGSINTNNHRIGYLKQALDPEERNKTAYNYLFQDENDYYDKITNFYKFSEILNLEDSVLNQKIQNFSGGEKVKLSILKLLIEEYDILFLDEPTNDLDIETLEWLENFINQTSKPILYVSHDETLLSKTANKILHIEQIKKKTECRYTLQKTDYNTYVKERIQKIEKQTQIAKGEKREFKKQQEKLNQIVQKVEHQQNTISRSDPHGAQLLKKKMHSLKSQEKKLSQKELTEIPDMEEKIHFFFEDAKIPKNKIILKLDLFELQVENKILASKMQLEIIGNTHLCIVGKNGVGKSTLLKRIYEKLKNRTDIKVGYMPQNYDDIFKKEETVLEFLAKTQSDITTSRMYLGNMNFTREEMTSKIKDLSNGTKAKLILISLVLAKCNVLILDEPTRNVSPLSNPVIRKVLKEFNGTIISVSHDRKYLEEVIDEIFLLTKDGLKKINDKSK